MEQEEKVTLEKIDRIRDRVRVSHREAKEALEEADGDVLEAIIRLEERPRWDARMEDQGKRVMEQIKELVRKGNVTMIRIRKGERVIVEFPATVGAVGVAGLIASVQLAVLGLIGAAAAVANRCVVEVEWQNDDGSRGCKTIDLDFFPKGEKDQRVYTPNASKASEDSPKHEDGKI